MYQHNLELLEEMSASSALQDLKTIHPIFITDMAMRTVGKKRNSLS